MTFDWLHTEGAEFIVKYKAPLAIICHEMIFAGV